MSRTTAFATAHASCVAAAWRIAGVVLGGAGKRLAGNPAPI